MKKIAVITGASSGVGLEISRRFIAKGWTAIGFARTEAKLAAAKKSLGEKFEYFALDVTNADQVSAAFAKIGERHGTIDLLVNNAAVFKMAKFSDCDVKDIASIVDTNLKGTLFCTHRALPLIRKPGGRIVNIASVSATHGIENQAIYCASKFGVDGFAEALGQELRADGIHITTVCPGGIDTPLWSQEGNPYPGDLKKLLQPDDIARMVETVTDLPPNVVMKKLIVFPSNEWH